ncbi:LysE/ArgO family amino acid transporter [Psychromonas sp. SR45-3]|uniref:LysE/ArgO family amino acid transporter n=1 Tax=Psychromonas sp. SR45-3 TaxID=2760930 RepID=UPI0015F8DF75|nr:LysE/ArgO family amino acid transporter [Psychromonas sp. SR45-3]MBB1273045.1 amino acid transporter [Psychromonas sp. SR45-3]
MLSTYFTGLTLMATLIMPIGMQNAFVLNQGIKRQFHLFVASFCSIADAVFMSAGVWGGAKVFNAYPWLLTSIGVIGSLFMGYYGFLCFRSAFKGKNNLTTDNKNRSFKAILIACCAFTILNPHVYIDTIVILGGFAANLTADQRPWFVLGGVSASFIWFFSLALLGQKLAPILSKPKSQQIIDIVIAILMWVLAAYLLYYVLIK